MFTNSANPKLSFALWTLLTCVWIYRCVQDKLHPAVNGGSGFAVHLVVAILFAGFAIYKGLALRNRTEEL